MTLWLGKREVQIIHIGRSHTAGDTIVWLPKERVLFAGDCVEYGATPYCGDAHFADWPGHARRRLRPSGRSIWCRAAGAASWVRQQVREGIEQHRFFHRRSVRPSRSRGVARAST